MPAPRSEPMQGDQTRAPYSSPVRADQARATRRAIVAAATELFAEQGFAATTIDAVAARAGVGRKTVFSSVGSKGALLKLAWDWALAGDDEPLAMSERPAVQAMLAERDPGRLVRLWVDMLLDVGLRATPVGVVVLAAADVDPEAKELLDTIRRETLDGATAFVTHLAGTGGLRSDLTVDRAADACWALVNSQLQHLLVTGRGWSPGDYRAWLVGVTSAMLLDPEGTAPPPPAVLVTDRPEAGRYEATIGGGTVGGLTYEVTSGLVVLLHTEVAPDLDGQDVADALVRRAFDDVRAAGGRSVLPVCPYVAWWVQRQPGYATLVHDPQR